MFAIHSLTWKLPFFALRTHSVEFIWNSFEVFLHQWPNFFLKRFFFFFLVFNEDFHSNKNSLNVQWALLLHMCHIARWTLIYEMHRIINEKLFKWSDFFFSCDNFSLTTTFHCYDERRPHTCWSNVTMRWCQFE